MYMVYHQLKTVDLNTLIIIFCLLLEYYLNAIKALRYNKKALKVDNVFFRDKKNTFLAIKYRMLYLKAEYNF